MSSDSDAADAVRRTLLTSVQGYARALAAMSDAELDAWIAICTAMDNRADVANSARRQWTRLRRQALAHRAARVT